MGNLKDMLLKNHPCSISCVSTILTVHRSTGSSQIWKSKTLCLEDNVTACYQAQSVRIETYSTEASYQKLPTNQSFSISTEHIVLNKEMLSVFLVNLI